MKANTAPSATGAPPGAGTGRRTDLPDLDFAVTGARAMTPGYSPPEQYGTARTDPRTDIYSLGATLYAALTGSWAEGAETAALLAPYGEWQGLAGELLLLGWARGLVPGASMDEARIARRRARRAA